MKRIHRNMRVLAAVVSLGLVVGGAQAASADNGRGKDVRAKEQGKEQGKEQARRSLEGARKAAKRQGRPASSRVVSTMELKGSVATVDATLRTIDFLVTQANAAAVRGQTVKLDVPTAAFISLGDSRVTLADLRAGDTGKITGLTETDIARNTAYLIELDRPLPKPPTPASTTGLVATTDAAAGTFVLTVQGLPVSFTLGTPSIVTVNKLAATLADLRANDRVEVTSVTDTIGRKVAYVVKATRSVPATPSTVRVDGVVASVSPSTSSFVLTMRSGASGTVTLANPALVVLNNVAATLADVHVNDRAVATAIPGATATPTLTAYLVTFTR